MTNPPNIDAIIDELSEAQRGGRALDLAIDCIRRPEEWAANVQSTLNPGCPLEYFDGEELPLYTSSLDAAMTLVPEGLSFEIRRSGTGDQGQATIWDPMTQPGLPSHKQWRVTGCATPALALCIASLRVRSALIDKEGGR